MLTIGGLCAGYGGLEMAVSAVFPNSRLAWVFENDPHASLILKAHNPDVPNYGDITSADWSALESIDILAAGFPCQNISNAGRREGITGDRSRIWNDVAKAVGTLRPKLVFLENVSVITRRGLSRVAGDLSEIGYDARWITLRASEVGAPHQRSRWFCIAYPSDSSGLRRAEWRAEHEGSGRKLLGTAECGRASTQDAYRESWNERRGTAAGQAKEGGHGPTLDDEASYLLPYSDSVGRNGRSWDEPQTDGRREPENGRYSPPEWWGDYLPAIRRWERVNGVAPAPTEVGPKGGKRLRATFAEWMMGLPVGHVTGVEGLNRSRQLKAIGNGVVPQQAEAALRILLDLN
ncbi:DNA cytosine methyltransferase [Kitasatospora mediocidica]|uniref:DNA cytosine methyltransferase n=1 Tax=Kitasatospora mediocidica TaxID=58352 RepID=UPI000A00250F|nr:DNA cytosine methyltransferase [Kitasatospora mediocidica]